MKTIYLIAYYYVKPKPHVRTTKKGWMKDINNISHDEQVALSQKLKTKDLSTSGVILDLGNQKVVRNSWANGKTFDELFAHYYTNYQKQLTPALRALGIVDTPNTPQNITANPTQVVQSETISSL